MHNFVVNRIKQTKCEIFYKQKELERVNDFTYLGIVLTSQLSFSSHLQTLVMKANSRVGLLYSRLDLQKMPIEVIMKVFICYILPIFEYGLLVWITGNFSDSSKQLVNATFTKFLKRYLNLPYCTNNSFVYFITQSLPLISLLEIISHKRIGTVRVPSCMHGVQLTFLNNLPPVEDISMESVWKNIPSFYWRSRAIWKLPSHSKFRRMLCREVCDTSHHEHCLTKCFHSYSKLDCKCIYCGDHLHAYHIAYGFCTAFD